MSITQLVRYDQARHALAQCECIDEAKDWADKAAALAAYARQADDPELEALARRIRARAFRRMGEISQELETGQGTRTELLPGTGKKLKSAVLSEAGISTSQAHRAEKVAEIPVEEFERRVDSDTPPTMTALVRGLGHVSHNSGEIEWYTPPDLIEAARDCMGGIDLDPASSDEAQQAVKGTRFFSVTDDGLSQPWDGRVWLNPPYAQPVINQFVEKVTTEPIDQACVLVNNATDTKWGQTLLASGSIVCFLKSRVRFVSPRGTAGAPLQGQMIVGIRVDRDRFIGAFETRGVILDAT